MARIEGNEYSAAQLGDLVEELLRVGASGPDYVMATADFTNAGSIVTPSPGPEGTVSLPATQRKVDESEATGNESSRPLYSWNGPGFGKHDA